MQPAVGERIAHIDDAIDTIREALVDKTKADFIADKMLKLMVELHAG